MDASAAQTHPATADLVHEDDVFLVRLAVAGDAGAFERLMRRYNQRLYRTARSILHNEMDAEEAVQEGWWKAYQNLAGFRAESSAATWLTRIVVNESLMLLRRNKSRSAVIQSVDAYQSPDEAMSSDKPALNLSEPLRPDEQAWHAELRRLIESRIDALPEKYRSVFMLRAVEEMSTAEVAAILDMPESTVRVRYMRARRLMQEGLEQTLQQQLRLAFSFAGERCDRIVEGVQRRIRELQA